MSNITINISSQVGNGCQTLTDQIVKFLDENGYCVTYTGSEDRESFSSESQGQKVVVIQNQLSRSMNEIG